MAVATVAVLLIGTSASYAAKAPSSPKHGGGGSGGGTSSVSLVLVNSTDGLAHYGQQVTFKVSTTATSEPFVRLDCYEKRVWVLSSSSGFFPSYAWPWTNVFTLSWDMWHTAGAAADCTATLYNGSTNYASTSFHVYP